MIRWPIRLPAPSQILDPPLIGNTVFYTNDLLRAGTVIGNLNATGVNLAPITSIGWTVRDAADPTAFTVHNASGNITMARMLDTLLTSKNSYSYTVRVVDALGAAATAPVLINVQTVPRPAVIFPQTRSIREDAATGFQLSPPLAATHPQVRCGPCLCARALNRTAHQRRRNTLLAARHARCRTRRATT